MARSVFVPSKRSHAWDMESRRNGHPEQHVQISHKDCDCRTAQMPMDRTKSGLSRRVACDAGHARTTDFDSLMDGSVAQSIRVHKSSLAMADVVGQVDRKFILIKCRCSGLLILVDQHAASEVTGARLLGQAHDIASQFRKPACRTTSFCISSASSQAT
jgi:DNA mismatch repair ATPase MutL